LQTKGLSTIADAWVDCVNGKIPLRSEVTEADVNAVVGISFPTQGVEAKVLSVYTSGCEQVSDGFLFFGNNPIREGVRFSSAGVSAKFQKIKDAPTPFIVVSTTLGSAVVRLKPWLTHGPSPLPPLIEAFTDVVMDDNYNYSFTEPLTAGDNGNYSGSHIKISATATVAIRSAADGGSEVVLSGTAHVHETAGDGTTFEGSFEKILKSYPKGVVVSLSSKFEGTLDVIDMGIGGSEQYKTLPYSPGEGQVSSSNLVKQWKIIPVTGSFSIIFKPVSVQGTRSLD
jgi:hypothetical protein